MQKLYDNDKLQKCENNYYDKQIKMNEKIIPLRERLYFEENLINLKESFEEIKNNERYIYVFLLDAHYQIYLQLDFHLIQLIFQKLFQLLFYLILYYLLYQDYL